MNTLLENNIKKMTVSSKALSSIVAVLLLFLMSIFGVLAFQGWINHWVTGIHGTIDEKELGLLGVEGIKGDKLYLKIGDNKTRISQVQVNGNQCLSKISLDKGVNGINLGNCTSYLMSGRNEIVLVTGNGVLSYPLHLDNKRFQEEKTSVTYLTISSQLEWEKNGSLDGIYVENGSVQLGYSRNTEKGLFAYWPLDDLVNGSGGIVKEYVDGMNATTNAGVTTGADGIFAGHSMGFDGIDDYLDLSSFDLSGHGQLSLMLWVYPTQISSSNPGHGGASRGDNEVVWFSHGGDAFTINLGNNDELYAYVDPGSNGGSGDDESCELTSSSSPMLVNSWQFVAAVYNGSSLFLYHNGSLIGSCSAGTRDFQSSGVHELGNHRSPEYDDHYSGRIAHVTVYNKSLSQEEISAKYLNRDKRTNYRGTYQSEVLNVSSSVTWEEVTLSASIPEQTTAEIRLEVLGEEETVLDSQVISIMDGNNTYSLDVTQGQRISFTLNGTTANISRTFSIDSVSIGYS